MNIKLLGVVPLTTVRLRRNLPACPTLSSGSVLLWDLGKLQLFCSSCEKCKSVKKQLPVQSINSSLCACLHSGQGVCEVRAEDFPLGWADGGGWLWKAFCSLESNGAALWRRPERLNPSSYKHKVSLCPWTPVLFKLSSKPLP